MRAKVVVILVGLVALAAGSCKDSTGPDVESLIGTWRATKAEYVSVADSNTKVDIVAQGSTLTRAAHGGETGIGRCFLRRLPLAFKPVLYTMGLS
jgi:hypothetical protein